MGNQHENDLIEMQLFICHAGGWHDGGLRVEVILVVDHLLKRDLMLVNMRLKI